MDLCGLLATASHQDCLGSTGTSMNAFHATAVEQSLGGPFYGPPTISAHRQWHDFRCDEWRGRLSYWSLFIVSFCFVPSARSDGMQKLPHDCDSETYQLSPRLSEITRLIEDQKPHQQKIDPEAPGGSS